MGGINKIIVLTTTIIIITIRIIVVYKISGLGKTIGIHQILIKSELIVILCYKMYNLTKKISNNWSPAIFQGLIDLCTTTGALISLKGDIRMH